MKTKRKIISFNTKDKMVSAAFLLPSLVGMLVFYILPFALIIYYSLVDSQISGKFVFLENYTQLIKNTAFQDAVANTLTLSAIAVPLAMLTSLILAMALNYGIPFTSTFRTVFLSTMMVPVASIVLIWEIIFHYNGVLNELLLNFGIDKIDWIKSDYSQRVIILLFLWKNLGYNMVLFLAALQSIPAELIEAAKLDGASSFQIFRKVKMRFLSSTILFVTILSLINSFKLFREVYLLTGDYPYGKLYLMQHFMNNTFRNLDYQRISAAAILMLMFMALVIGALFAVENWYGKDMDG